MTEDRNRGHVTEPRPLGSGLISGYQIIGKSGFRIPGYQDADLHRLTLNYILNHGFIFCRMNRKGGKLDGINPCDSNLKSNSKLKKEI